MRKINLILGFVIIISVATVVVAVGVILNAARKLRLVVLRCMFIAAFKIIRIADKLTFGRIKAIHALYWPTMWLSHYLNGSGKTLVVPTEVMEQATPLFTNRCGYLIDSHNGINVVGLHHSTLFFMQMHKEIQNSYYWNFELWLKERWPHYEAYMFS